MLRDYVAKILASHATLGSYQSPLDRMVHVYATLEVGDRKFIAQRDVAPRLIDNSTWWETERAAAYAVALKVLDAMEEENGSTPDLLGLPPVQGGEEPGAGSAQPPRSNARRPFGPDLFGIFDV